MRAGPWEIALVVLGFACFSAGLVAHALAPEADRGEVETAQRSGASRRAVWLLKVIVAVMLLVVILSCLDEIETWPRSTGRLLPDRLLALLGPLDTHGAQIWSWLRGNHWINWLSYDASVWFPLLVIPWLAWRSIGLLLRGGTSMHGPLDHVFDSAASTRRFVGYSFALLALLLAAVPALGLAGLVVLHHALEVVR